MLDADVAGHLSSWGASSRRRQEDREVALKVNLDDLDRVLPLLVPCQTRPWPLNSSSSLATLLCDTR
jgi:hypothetical protein